VIRISIAIAYLKAQSYVVVRGWNVRVSGRIMKIVLVCCLVIRGDELLMQLFTMRIWESERRQFEVKAEQSEPQLRLVRG
jgi:hypothetical protein